jgi:glucokinase
LCQATVELFVSILASEAGNLVLKVLATGGI